MLGLSHKIDLSEAYIDGTKVKAKKGALRLAFQEQSNFEGKRAA
jgi:hypothetical protein